VGYTRQTCNNCKQQKTGAVRCKQVPGCVQTIVYGFCCFASCGWQAASARKPGLLLKECLLKCTNTCGGSLHGSAQDEQSIGPTHLPTMA
jgi:hypothetical protein